MWCPAEVAAPRGTRSPQEQLWESPVDPLWEPIRLVQDNVWNSRLGTIVLGWHWEFWGYHICIPYRVKSRKTWVTHIYLTILVYYYKSHLSHFLFPHGYGDQKTFKPQSWITWRLLTFLLMPRSFTDVTAWGAYGHLSALLLHSSQSARGLMLGRLPLTMGNGN